MLSVVLSSLLDAHDLDAWNGNGTTLETSLHQKMQRRGEERGGEGKRREERGTTD